MLALCHAETVAVVPQGGNTGLVGGQTPESNQAIVLSTGRLRAVRELDLASHSLTVEAGVTLAEVQQMAEDARSAAIWRAMPAEQR